MTDAEIRKELDRIITYGKDSFGPGDWLIHKHTKIELILKFIRDNFDEKSEEESSAQ